jgi:hypothetical protein
VDSIEVSKKEGTLTAVGYACPVDVTKKITKLGYKAELLSMGP